MSILENPKYSYLTKAQPFFFRIWKKLFYYYCKVVFTFYTPLTINGRKNLPKDAAIFCSNHNSHMDVALISAAVGKSFNYFGMLAAIDYWFDSSAKRILTNLIMNLIPISRNSDQNSGKVTFNDTISLCGVFMDNDNRNLVIFPEGSRGMPNEIKPFRSGAARFAIALKKPIVPIYIEGSAFAWPKGKIFMRPCKIKINILEPIYPNDYISIGNDNISDAKSMIKDLEKKIINEREKYVL